MKTVLIDDEPLARELVKEYLESFPDIEIAGECNDGFEGIKMISEVQPDLIFLDIQMPRITGFEMLELLDEPPAVIFTTAFDEYAIKAFEEQAIDYLLKPFSQERFNQAIQKFLSHSPEIKSKTRDLLDSGINKQSQNRIVIKDGSKIKIIPLHEVLYLEAADDYVKVCTKERTYLKKKTMRSFEEVIPEEQFVRLHRSYLVNVSQITGIHPFEKDHHVALLKSGQKIPVSKSGYQKLKNALDL